MADEFNPHQLAQSMAQMAEQMRPVIEMAEGQRKLLESQGWSPTAAEAYALELLLGPRLALSSGAKS
jgi:hypothetical protein